MQNWPLQIESHSDGKNNEEYADRIHCVRELLSKTGFSTGSLGMLMVHKMLKRALKILMWLVASLLSLFLGMVVLLEKPYIRNIDEFRTTGQLETVRVSYGHACGEEFLSDGEYKYILAIPEGGKNPLDIPGIYFDSSFELVGYSYTIKRKNYLTGEVTKVRSERFDTVEWSAILPYNIYDPNSEDLRKKVYSPLNWKSDNINSKFIVQSDVNKGEC